MNGNTLVVICAYAGELERIEAFRHVYEHHNCPILVVSPTDAPITDYAGHVCRSGGLLGYIGQVSIDRQHEYLSLALQQEADWYLINDADSFCITPEIPKYLYEDPDVVWSNEIADIRQLGYHDPLPHIAMQVPYFMSRQTLQKYVAAGKQVACPITPFIDWYMVQAAYAADVRHDGFIDGTTFGTHIEQNVRLLEHRVQLGYNMVHSVKDSAVLDRALLARQRRGSELVYDYGGEPVKTALPA